MSESSDQLGHDGRDQRHAASSRCFRTYHTKFVRQHVISEDGRPFPSYFGPIEIEAGGPFVLHMGAKPHSGAECPEPCVLCRNGYVPGRQLEAPPAADGSRTCRPAMQNVSKPDIMSSRLHYAVAAVAACSRTVAVCLTARGRSHPNPPSAGAIRILLRPV